MFKHSAYLNPRPDKKFVQLLYSTVLSEMSRGSFAVMYLKKISSTAFPFLYMRRYNDNAGWCKSQEIGVWFKKTDIKRDIIETKETIIKKRPRLHLRSPGPGPGPDPGPGSAPAPAPDPAVPESAFYWHTNVSNFSRERVTWVTEKLWFTAMSASIGFQAYSTEKYWTFSVQTHKILMVTMVSVERISVFR